MKLLLTSAGITNKSLRDALISLLPRKAEECNLAFIPTAATVEPGDKSWQIEDLSNLQKIGFRELDIVDFSAVPRDIWLPRLQHADVLVFSGGNTFHLIHMMKQRGLDSDLKDLLKTRVYMGISAGSVVACTSLMLSDSASMYSESIGDVKDDSGLGYVDCHIRPHLNSPFFPKVRVEKIREQAKESSTPIYAIDDQSAVMVNDKNLQIISEGKWKKIG